MSVVIKYNTSCNHNSSFCNISLANGRYSQHIVDDNDNELIRSSFDVSSEVMAKGSVKSTAGPVLKFSLKEIKNCIIVEFDNTLYTPPQSSYQLSNNWIPCLLQKELVIASQLKSTPESLTNGTVNKSVYRLSCAYYAVRYHIIVLTERNYTPFLEEVIRHIYTECNIKGFPTVDPEWLKIVYTPHGEDAFAFKEKFMRELRVELGSYANILYVHHHGPTLRYLHSLLVDNKIQGIWFTPSETPSSSLENTKQDTEFSPTLGPKGKLVGIIGPPGCGKTFCYKEFLKHFSGCNRISTDILRLAEISRRSGGSLNSTSFREVAQDREFTKKMYVEIEKEIQRELLNGRICFVDTCNDEEMRIDINGYAETHLFSYMPTIKNDGKLMVSPSFFAWIVTNVMKRTHQQNEESTLVGVSLPLVFRVCLYKCIKCVKMAMDLAFNRKSTLYRYTEWWNTNLDSTPDAIILKTIMVRAMKLFDTNVRVTDRVIADIIGDTFTVLPLVRRTDGSTPRSYIQLHATGGYQSQDKQSNFYSRNSGSEIGASSYFQSGSTLGTNWSHGIGGPISTDINPYDFSGNKKSVEFQNKDRSRIRKSDEHPFDIVSSRNRHRYKHQYNTVYRNSSKDTVRQDSILSIMMKLGANVSKAIPSAKELTDIWITHLEKCSTKYIILDTKIGFIVPPEVILSFVPQLNNSNVYLNYITVCDQSHKNFNYFMELIGRMVTVDFISDPSNSGNGNGGGNKHIGKIYVEIKVHNNMIARSLESTTSSNHYLLQLATTTSTAFDIPLLRTKTVKGKLPLILF